MGSEHGSGATPTPRNAISTALDFVALSQRLRAPSFGNPDEPPQAIVNTEGYPRSAVDPGPQNPTLNDR